MSSRGFQPVEKDIHRMKTDLSQSKGILGRASRFLETTAKLAIENAPFADVSAKLGFLDTVSLMLYEKAGPGMNPRVRRILQRAQKTGGRHFAVRCAQEYGVLRKLNAARHSISGYLDCGANTGDTTVGARAYFDDSIPVIAFEPVSATYLQLENNCRRFPNVHCFKVGLGSRSERRKIKVPAVAPSAETASFLTFTPTHKAERPWEAKTVEQEVEVFTLDDFLAEEPLEMGCNLLTHINVEGFEYNVLLGARRTVFEKTKVLIAMVNYGLFEGESAFEEIFDLLRKDFMFCGFIESLSMGDDGESLFQKAMFIRREREG